MRGSLLSRSRKYGEGRDDGRAKPIWKHPPVCLCVVSNADIHKAVPPQRRISKSVSMTRPHVSIPPSPLLHLRAGNNDLCNNERPQMSSRARAHLRRHTQACIPCQSSKRRCSSGLPCSHCIRRNCESACVYNRDRRKRQPGPPSLPISEPGLVQAGESQLPLPRQNLRTPPQPSFPTPPTPDVDVSSARAAPDSNVPGDTPEDHAFLQPRILKDSSGNDGMDRHTGARCHIALLSHRQKYFQRLTPCFYSLRREFSNNCLLASGPRHHSKPDRAIAVYRVQLQ